MPAPGSVRGTPMHLASIHRLLDRELAEPVILTALDDQNLYVRGQADSASEERHVFRCDRLARAIGRYFDVRRCRSSEDDE